MDWILYKVVADNRGIYSHIAYWTGRELSRDWREAERYPTQDAAMAVKADLRRKVRGLAPTLAKQELVEGLHRHYSELSCHLTDSDLQSAG